MHPRQQQPPPNYPPGQHWQPPQPQQYGPPQRPPKRTSPAVIVLAVIGGVLGLLLVIGGAAALLGSGDTPESTAAGDGPAPKTAAAADPSKLDEAGNFACTDFAKGYKAAQTDRARVELADKVNKWASKSKSLNIAAHAAGLGRTAESADQSWKLAADVFAATCLDRGWTAGSAK